LSIQSYHQSATTECGAEVGATGATKQPAKSAKSKVCKKLWGNWRSVFIFYRV